MKGEPRVWVLFARSRHWKVVALAAVVLAVGETFLPAGPVDVPIGDGRAAVAVYLVPLLAAASWVVCVPPPGPDLERLLPDGLMRGRRACWYLAASLLLVSAAAGPLALRFSTLLAGVVPGRAALIGVGLATTTALLLPPRTAWLPPFAVAVLMWLYGTTDSQGAAAAWAVPLYGAASVPAALVALGLWVGAGVLYVVRDGCTVAD